MGLKTYKPRTEGQRFRVSQDFAEITAEKPERGLTVAKRKTAGRNNVGRITTRQRGGGAKRRYRIIDFRRDKAGIPARVATIEYDPNRSANIALLNYLDGEKRYILAPEGLKVGQLLLSGAEAEPSVGNAIPLAKVPLGMQVHAVELTPGSGAKIARSAGNACQVQARDGDYVSLRLPSGEIRRVRSNCLATVGAVGNGDWENVKLGKAGRKRWLGIRPTVRGVAMNPVDHPRGGGEGRSSGGGDPQSPWGKLAKGGKTRKPRKASDKVIVKRRK